MEPYQVSLLIAFGLAIAELLTLSFILLGFGLGMAMVSLLQFVTGAYSFNRDVIVFAMFSLAAIVAFRRIFKKRSDQKRLADDDINRY